MLIKVQNMLSGPKEYGSYPAQILINSTWIHTEQINLNKGEWQLICGAIIHAPTHSVGAFHFWTTFECCHTIKIWIHSVIIITQILNSQKCEIEQFYGLKKENIGPVMKIPKLTPILCFNQLSRLVSQNGTQFGAWKYPTNNN